jgi:hypothetical protein
MLMWDPSEGATGYNLYESIGSNPYARLLNTAATSVTVQPSLTDITRYYVTAFSVNAESGPSNILTNKPPPMPGLSFEAESGAITAPFFVLNGAVRQDVQTVAADGGRASYTFIITNAGSYTVSGAVNAPDDGANSFYVNIDAEPIETNAWSIPSTIGGFEWRTVRYTGETNDHAFTLTKAQHTLIFRGREAGCLLDKIVVAPLTNAVPPPTAPPAPTNLRGTQVNGSRLDLSWSAALAYSSHIERAPMGGVFAQIGTTPPGTLHFTTSAKKNETWRFQVRSCNLAGCSVPSTELVWSDR